MSATAYVHARLIDPDSGYDGPGCLLARDGLIAQVAQGPTLGALSADIEVVDCRGQVLCPGLVDIRVKTGEPGSETKETLKSACLAAAAGGVTSIVVQPLTMKRSTELREAHMSMLVAQTLLAESMRRTGATRPASDSFADTGAYEAAVAEWEADADANEKAMKDLAQQVRDAEDSYNRAFFESQPQALWDAFVEDIKQEFLPSHPRDGHCPTCGHVVDEEQAGKASKSST